MSKTHEDFSIDIRGRADRIIYSQGGKSLTVDSELLMGDPSLVLYASSIKAWGDGSPVLPSEKKQIIENIRNSLRPKWGEIEVSDDL